MTPTDDFSEILNLFQIEKIFSIVVAFAAIIVIAKLIKKGGSKTEELVPSYRLLILQITTVFSFSLYILGTIAVVFGILQPTKELLLALGGSAAVAIGFSMKDLVASIVSGVTLLFDRPFQVGDRVTFGDIYGEITNIGLRAVRVQTLDDSEVTIPNLKFMTDAVSSGNSGALDMMIVCDFYLALDIDIPKAKRLLEEVVYTSRFAYLKKPVKIVLQEVIVAERIALKASVKAYVFDVRYEKDFQTDIYERAYATLNKNEIGRPPLSHPTKS